MDACNAFLIGRVSRLVARRRGLPVPFAATRAGNEPSETAIPWPAEPDAPVGKHHDNFLFFLMWGWPPRWPCHCCCSFTPAACLACAFMLANALTVLSLLLYAAGSFLPLNATVMVSNAAWISALALVYVGVRQFFGLHPHVWRSAALAILCVVAITAMLYGSRGRAHRAVFRDHLRGHGRHGLRDRRRAQADLHARRGAVSDAVDPGLAALHLLRVLVYGLGWKRPARCCIPRLGHCSSLSAAR